MVAVMGCVLFVLDGGWGVLECYLLYTMYNGAHTPAHIHPTHQRIPTHTQLVLGKPPRQDPPCFEDILLAQGIDPQELTRQYTHGPRPGYEGPPKGPRPYAALVDSNPRLLGGKGREGGGGAVRGGRQGCSRGGSGGSGGSSRREGQGSAVGVCLLMLLMMLLMMVLAARVCACDENTPLHIHHTPRPPKHSLVHQPLQQHTQPPLTPQQPQHQRQPPPPPMACRPWGTHAGVQIQAHPCGAARRRYQPHLWGRSRDTRHLQGPPMGQYMGTMWGMLGRMGASGGNWIP